MRTRKFNGEEYEYDSLHFSKQEAVTRSKELKRQGYSVRRTTGSTTITHSPYYNLWKRNR